MRFKQFGMIVVMLLLTFAIGGFGCSSSSSDDDYVADTSGDTGRGGDSGEGGDDTVGDIVAVAPADFSASTNLSITEGVISPSGSYTFRLTGDVEIPATAIVEDVTYEWATADADVVIENPNQKSTAVTVPASVTGTVEFNLTVSYKGDSDEATTTVTLNDPTVSGILYVNATADGSGDGSSWANALPGNGETMNLQTVIDEVGDAIESSDLEAVEIWVKAGTYIPTWHWGEGDAKKSSFRLRNGVSVIGGFAGDESSKSARVKSGEAGRIYANETILSGDLDGNDTPLETTCATLVPGTPTDEGEGLRIPLAETAKACSEEGAYIKEIAKPSSYGENVIHVVYNDAAVELNGTAILDGVVIRGGNSGHIDNRHGGGIYNSDASPTIISTIVENNRARNGGGIYNENGASPSIISSIIQYNYASGNGGGIATSNYASSRIESSIIHYNYASDFGGGISTWKSSQSYVTASLIKSNWAGNNGGGVRDGDKSASFYRASVIKNNSANGSGGGVYSIDARTVTTIVSSIIQSNFASNSKGGGIFIGRDATLGVVNSAVIENIANSSGGGIGGGTNIWRISVYNSVISDNVSGRVDLPKRIEIDSYETTNTVEESVVFSSIVKSVPAGNSTVRNSSVKFFNMLDGLDEAPDIGEIEFGSYSGLTGKTYTLP
ncbi:MAG: hypothetical protein ACN4E2_01245, partial [Nitrospinota bacterium]